MQRMMSKVLYFSMGAQGESQHQIVATMSPRRTARVRKVALVLELAGQSSSSQLGLTWLTRGWSPMTRSGESRQLGEGCLRMTPIKLLDLTKEITGRAATRTVRWGAAFSKPGGKLMYQACQLSQRVNKVIASRRTCLSARRAYQAAALAVFDLVNGCAALAAEANELI